MYSEIEKFAKDNIDNFMAVRNQSNEICAFFEYKNSTLWFIEGKVHGSKGIEENENIQKQYKVRNARENNRIKGLL